MRGHGPIGRAIDVTVPKDIYILLTKLQLRRLEEDVRPSLASKAAIVAEAIWTLAVKEGLVEEPGKETVGV